MEKQQAEKIIVYGFLLLLVIDVASVTLNPKKQALPDSIPSHSSETPKETASPSSKSSSENS